jgi:mannose-6-phosphate isomerase|tara:strand:+ start:349 stop:684 length:336 start_codon:yes stop_codon:yes gene_type:complete
MSRRIEKPWGYEEIWAETDSYVAKKIFIKKGNRLSSQYHKIKEETIYVLEGNLRLQFEEHARLMILGETYHIKPGTIHRFCADRNDVTLMEVSTPHLDDVVRLEDDYGRAE